jgi:hypothetical protein
MPTPPAEVAGRAGAIELYMVNYDMGEVIPDFSSYSSTHYFISSPPSRTEDYTIMFQLLAQETFLDEAADIRDS